MRLVVSLFLLCFVFASGYADGKTLVFNDPAGDDNGPGKYVYPTDPVYAVGSFDLRKLEVRDRGETVEFRVTMRARIGDPWESKNWGGNGFSLQMIQVYIDTDHKEGSGFRDALPGINAEFARESYWEKVVVLSPQGRERLSSEIDLKAKSMAAGIVIPRRTYAAGRTIIGVVSKKDLGGSPSGQWGFQAVVQSNEGFPEKSDFLSRKVNEVEGPHRFGGGDDSDCDPHIIDLLSGDAKGDRSEVAGQHKMLGAYSCKDGKRAVLSMVYRETAVDK